jgi:hypothetical protein
MLESNVSVGDTCKEIGVTRHDSDDAVTEQKHNAEFLTVNRNFELSPRSVWQAMAEPMSAKVATYYKEIYKINSGFVKAAASFIEAETEEVGKTVSEKVSEFSKSAPAGSEGVVAMTKSSIAASTSTYESMTKAAKQVLEIVDSNVEAATKAGQAAVSPVSKGKAKKAA